VVRIIPVRRLARFVAVPHKPAQAAAKVGAGVVAECAREVLHPSEGVGEVDGLESPRLDVGRWTVLVGLE